MVGNVRVRRDLRARQEPGNNYQPRANTDHARERFVHLRLDGQRSLPVPVHAAAPLVLSSYEPLVVLDYRF